MRKKLSSWYFDLLYKYIIKGCSGQNKFLFIKQCFHFSVRNKGRRETELVVNLTKVRTNENASLTSSPRHFLIAWNLGDSDNTINLTL